jgi:hypothetical protein
MKFSILWLWSTAGRANARRTQVLAATIWARRVEFNKTARFFVISASVQPVKLNLEKGLS